MDSQQKKQFDETCDELNLEVSKILLDALRGTRDKTDNTAVANAIKFLSLHGRRLEPPPIVPSETDDDLFEIDDE